jgi:hypothetical protein
MRGYLLAIWVLFGIFGTATVASAAAVSPQAHAQAEAILAQYPDGGPGLRAAIAAAVEADPSFAAAVIDAAATANPLQQQAIGAGLADAVNFFAAIGNDWARAAQATILAALSNAAPVVAAAFTAAVGPTVAQSGLSPPSGLSMSTNRCVSRSRPPNNDHGEGRGHDCD